MFYTLCSQYQMDLLEHHNHTEEKILPVDGKILLQVGRPTKSEIPPPELKLFPGEKENTHNQEEAGNHRSQDDGE